MTFSDSAISAARQRMATECSAVQAAFDLVSGGTHGDDSLKPFCRIYRRALLLWLWLDDAFPGEMDHIVEGLGSMGTRIAKVAGKGGTSLVLEAILRHECDFVAKLKSSIDHRAMACAA